MGVTRQTPEDAERRALESELARADKLRAVGQLASGIAHELNTPIQYVGDNLTFLRKAFEHLTRFVEPALEREQGPALQKLQFIYDNIPAALDAAIEGCAKVAEIVSAMKFFAQRDGQDYCASDINLGLTSTLAVARNAIKFVADVETHLGELPPVECRIGDLNQVFLNLITNAAHAIADRHAAHAQRGKITISTRVRDERVVIEIADDGCGMPPHVQARVFEPFFTTKEVGRGMGQGLAMSRSVVVDRHGGAIRFESAEGNGSTFFVELPIRHTPVPDTD